MGGQYGWTPNYLIYIDKKKDGRSDIVSNFLCFFYLGLDTNGPSGGRMDGRRRISGHWGRVGVVVSLFFFCDTSAIYRRMQGYVCYVFFYSGFLCGWASGATGGLYEGRERKKRGMDVMCLDVLVLSVCFSAFLPFAFCLFAVSFLLFLFLCVFCTVHLLASLLLRGGRTLGPTLVSLVSLGIFWLSSGLTVSRGI